jgi:CRP-like cAMP-binding protein
VQGFELEFEANSVICRQGDPSSDLYFLQSGRLLVCTISGTQVKAISRISPGEFVGELSFFDGRARSSHIVTLEKSKLIQLPKQEISHLLPNWYIRVGINITKKIRLLDQVIHESKIRRSNAEESKPLSIEDQRKLYELLTN